MLTKTNQKIVDFSKNIYTELLKFGTIGAVAFLIDFTLYNVLRYVALENNPLFAKVISVTVSTIFAWLGNRYWTYKARSKNSTKMELVLFISMNIIGLGISLLCAAISHHVLGFTSLLADNIAANGVGLFLGTAFRFIAYRLWVFPSAPLETEQTIVNQIKVPQYAKHKY